MEPAPDPAGMGRLDWRAERMTHPGALVAVTQLCLATACQHADYGALLRESCLPQFQAHMEAVGRTLWCDWGKTIR